VNTPIRSGAAHVGAVQWVHRRGLLWSGSHGTVSGSDVTVDGGLDLADGRERVGGWTWCSVPSATHIGEPTSQPQHIDGALLSVPEMGLASFGQLDLTVRAGRISGYEFRQLTVAPDGPEDPAVAAILARYGSPR
jgi:hypothetical protein